MLPDWKSVDLLSEVSSCESADESFWESSATDSASELESETKTEFSGSVPPEVHSDSLECSEDSNCDDLPPPKKVKADKLDDESDDDNESDEVKMEAPADIFQQL